MSREHAERDMVAILATAMAKKLREPQNRAKGGWENERPFDLIEKLQGEFKELAAAVLAADWNDPTCVAAVVKECADVGAYAGMIADNATNGRWKR